MALKHLSNSHQKLLKSVHMIVAGVWLACVILLTLLPAIPRDDIGGDELYMYNVVYHFVDMRVLTPAAILTLLTGLIYSLFTKWGFVRHGWIVYKWIATLAIILVGTFYLGPMVSRMLDITDSSRAAALQNPAYLDGTAIGLGAGIVNSILLMGAVFVSVYKPWKNTTR